MLLVHILFPSDLVWLFWTKDRTIGLSRTLLAIVHQGLQRNKYTHTQHVNTLLLKVKYLTYSEIILGIDSVIERWRYIATSTLIGWAPTPNDLYYLPT